MDRRNFLKGTFGGVATTGLIVAATSKEVEAFVCNLVPNQPLVVPALDPMKADVGETLFNSRGKPVAIIVGTDVHTDSVEVSTYRSINKHYIPGMTTMTYTAVAIGPLR